MTVISDIYNLQVSGNAASALQELEKRLQTVTDVFEAQTDRLDKYRNQVDAVSDRLKLLGETGVQAANLIEEISDPVERVRIASELFNQQLTATPTVFDRVNDRLLEYRARLQLIPGPLKAVLLGQVALAGVAGGVLVKSIQAAAKADTYLAAQLDVLSRASDTALASISRFAIGDGGLAGVSVAAADAGRGLNDLAGYFDALEDSGTAGYIAVNNIKTAMTAVLTGPLWPLITGVRLLNDAFGEGEEAAARFNAELVSQLRLEAARELNEERRKKFEDAIKRTERQRLEGVKFRAEMVKTSGVFIGETELSTTAAELYTQAVDAENKKSRERLAVREELARVIGKERLVQLGLLEVEEKKEKTTAPAREKEQAYYTDILNWNIKLIEAEKERQRVEEEAAAKRLQDAEEYGRSLIARLNDAAAKRAEDGARAAAEALSDLGRAAQDEADAKARRLSDALTSVRDDALSTAAAITDLAIQTALAGGGFESFAQQSLQALGSFASQAGKVLFFTGLGLEAIASVFPGGAVAAGLGLMAVGSVISGLAQGMGDGAGGGSGAASRVIDDVRGAADRRAREDEARDRELPPIILKIGTREFGEAIMDTQRRGYA